MNLDLYGTENFDRLLYDSLADKALNLSYLCINIQKKYIPRRRQILAPFNNYRNTERIR